MKWMVLLVGRDGRPLPMTVSDADDSIAIFDTYAEADDTAVTTGCGQAYGYEVIGWDHFPEGA